MPTEMLPLHQLGLLLQKTSKSLDLNTLCPRDGLARKKRNSPSPGLEPGSSTPRRASRFNTYPFSTDVLPLHQLGLLRCCSFNLCISYCGQR
ncbi:unnamed protein product [Fusarium graminearum]|nr:unnamed protein product [Fusarium graminearum]